MEFSEILNGLLKSRNLTAYRLSKEAGISQRLIGYWKKGEKKPSAGNLQKLSDYFHVSTDYLLTGKEPKKLSPPVDKTEEDDDDIDINDINFALSGEVHELSEDEIQEIISVAKFVRQQRKLRDKKKSIDEEKKDG